MKNKRLSKCRFNFGFWKVIYITLPIGAVLFLVCFFVGLDIVKGSKFSFSVFLQYVVFLIISLGLLTINKKAYIEDGIVYEKLSCFFINLKRKVWDLSTYSSIKLDVGYGLTSNSLGYERSSEFYTLGFYDGLKCCDFKVGFYCQFGKRNKSSLSKAVKYAKTLSDLTGKPVIYSASVKRDLNNDL